MGGEGGRREGENEGRRERERGRERERERDLTSIPSHSALIGASIFISTVVLGTIIIIVDVKSEHIGKSDNE